MKLTRPVPMWQQVADHVRNQILDGTYTAGQPLPSEEALAAEFGVSRPTVREGMKALTAEGLVEVSRPRGTIVRDPFGRPTRTEFHARTWIDDGDDWGDLDDPTFVRLDATSDQADLLDVPAGEPLLVRQATQRSDGMRRLSRVLVPFSVAATTPWADDSHLPNSKKLYDYFHTEHIVLGWTERVRARMPVGDEIAQLEAPSGVALLVILRRCHFYEDQAEHALFLEETRYRADQIEIAYKPL